MQRGLLLGNSHLAALKIAWDRAPERWPGLTLDFIGARGNQLKDVAVINRRLVPRTQEARAHFLLVNGCEEASLEGYDFIALCGLGFGAAAAVLLHERCRFPGLPSVARGLSPGAPPLVSRAAARALMEDLLRLRFGYALAGRIARDVNVPLVLIEQPRPSVDCLEDTDETFAAFRAVHDAGDAAVVGELHAAALPHAAAGLGVVLPQPAETIRAGLFTAPEWIEGSFRLSRSGQDDPHSAADRGHANPSYGALVLDALSNVAPDLPGNGSSPRL